MSNAIEAKGKSIVCFEIVVHKDDMKKIEKETVRFAKNTKIFNTRPVIIKPDSGAENLVPIVTENLKRFGFHLIGCQTKQQRSESVSKTEKREITAVHKTIRSGQSYEIDGDMVLFGNLNSGAEIKATGNIVILGSNSGIVHAGADGDEGAVIFSMKLLSPQIRIADKVARAPRENRAETEPEIAFLSSSTIIVQSYNDWLIRNEKLNLGI